MVDPDRLRAICNDAVAALQPVIREHQISEDELHAAAAFLNRVGAEGVFPSMLDIAFAMTIIDRRREGTPGTRPNLEGPEYVPGAPLRGDGDLIEGEPAPGVPLLELHGKITDAVNGRPLGGAELDLWHADEHGGYDRVGNHLRGVIVSDANGDYAVNTMLPKDYAEHQGDAIGELLALMGRHSYRAAHIHFKLRVDGEERLTSQVFRGDSPYLDSDYVFGAVSPDLVLDLHPRDRVDDHEVYEARFDIAVPPLAEVAS
jgi:protocatechuate 3,4-dioxygenase beta subunit